MIPKIKTFPTTKFIGKKLSFTYANYRAFELWSSFMPRRKEIQNTLGTELYNIQINSDNFDFNPNTPFIKWAAVAVNNFDLIPVGMESLEIPEGLYAIFNYKGTSGDAATFFKSIYSEWLPNCGYKIDCRPQFEILGDKYQKDDPNSEEEIWIPIRTNV